MKTLVMLSNHHVHLTHEACHALFGDKGLTFARYLAEEGGPWSSNELVEVHGPKGALGRFRVLGPLRPYTQVELLKSDCFKLIFKQGCARNAVVIFINQNVNF